jgi:hypothetical protein
VFAFTVIAIGQKFYASSFSLNGKDPCKRSAYESSESQVPAAVAMACGKPTTMT